MPRPELVWVGPYLSAGGYASVTRSYIRSLIAVGERPVVISVSVEQRHVLSDEELRIYEAHSKLERLVGKDVHLVINLTPLDAQVVMERVVRSLERLNARVVRKTIVTIFETESIPAVWLDPLLEFDQVVVPTNFNLRTFEAAGVPSEKLIKVPYALDLGMFYRGKRSSNGRFRLLYICDFNFRKGIDLLVEAFCTAFSAADDVELLIKTMNFFTPSGVGLSELVESSIRKRFGSLALDKLPRIILDVGTVNNEELRRLYWDADLYVSMDRANGWGMPVLEAMACGTPSAAIDYSGGTDILNEKNGYPIATTGGLIPVDGRLVDEAPIYQGQYWAEVTVSAIVSVLRQAREDPERTSKVEFGLEWVKSFDFPVIGRAFREAVLL